MRIAFIGCSGSGKTTLARWISEKYELPFNPVGARSVATAMGFAYPYDVDRASENWYRDLMRAGLDPQLAAHKALYYYEPGMKTCRELFQKRLLQEKIAWEAEHEHFVTDRTTMDQVAYAGFHDNTALSVEEIETAKKAVERYNIIFYTPAETFVDPGNDPARKMDPAYHILFDIFLRGFISSWTARSSVYWLTTEGVGNRQALVAKALKYHADAEVR